MDKHVMLSYLLLFNKRLEFSIQNSHVHGAKQTRWKFAAFPYYHREKPNRKSLSEIEKPRIQCFGIHCLNVLLT